MRVSAVADHSGPFDLFAAPQNAASARPTTPCFTPGTLIKTDQGEIPVEDLKLGDRVLTIDSGFKPIRWIGRNSFSQEQLAQNPELNPVRIAKGSLGDGLPERDMLLSQQHRMLFRSAQMAMLFATPETLVAAKHMTALPGVDITTPDEVTYIHFMCDAHEIVCADGAWSESFQPDEMKFDGSDDAIMRELVQIFPDLARPSGKDQFACARICLEEHEARLLFA
ncbi:MAG: Hint domain-containing protein [Sulfitobacter sp.]